MELSFPLHENMGTLFQLIYRIEKIFEEEGILHELESYTPLVPDGSNFKATTLGELS